MSDLFHRRVLIRFVKSADLATAIAAFTLACLRFYPFGSVARMLSHRVSVLNAVLFVGLVFVWHGAFSLAGLYRARRTRGIRHEFLDVMRGITLATAALVVWRGLFDVQLFTAAFFLWYWGAGIVLLGGFRIALQGFLRYLRRHGRNMRHLLIVGTNDRALRTAQGRLEDPNLGYRLAGFVDDPWPGAKDVRAFGRVVASLTDFPDFLRQNAVDEVVICLPLRSFHQESLGMVKLCERLGVNAGFPPDQFSTSYQPPREGRESPRALTAVLGGAHEGAAYLVKRLLDFCVALVLIILLAPLLLSIALLIRITSAGDVLFVQPRIGLNRRRFSMYKFRTMRPEAEEWLGKLEPANEVRGPVFKMKNDPRVTGIGRFLRRTSLDELPQLFNVLLGQMSLVGPRPLPVRDYSGFTEDWHRRRFSVRPGITCLWQIRGRSNVSFQEWMELDLFYIDNWSLWLDLKILLMTIPVVLGGRGAF